MCLENLEFFVKNSDLRNIAQSMIIEREMNSDLISCVMLGWLVDW